MALVLRSATPSEALPLTGAMTRELQQRYGDVGPGPLDEREFQEPPAVFLIAELDGRPVGCAGLRLLEPGVGELKRMYVDPDARGRGVGRALLRELVKRAMADGLGRLLLEVGARQPEAIGLYFGEGFMPVPAYGPFRDEPMSRCFGLEL